MGFFIALQFLTTLPSPFRRNFQADELGRAQAYFPLVGLLLGLLIAGLDALLSTFFPAQIVAVILVIALALLSGGIHLDGLIDTCDGLFLQRSKDERLAIMRDSRVGSFGVIGAVAIVLLKVAGLSALPSGSRLAALLLAPTISRWGLVFAIAAFPYARNAGRGVAFQGHGRLPLLWATLLAVGVAVAVWPQGGALLLALAVFWTALAARFMSGRLGGLTGDSYGALEETTEALVFLGASFAWPG